MMAIGFLGYVLPFGQMSLWGVQVLAPNANLLLKINLTLLECLVKIYHNIYNLIFYLYLNSSSAIQLLLLSESSVAEYHLYAVAVLPILAKPADSQPLLLKGSPARHS